VVTEPCAADSSADVLRESSGVGSCQKPWTTDMAYTDHCKVTGIYLMYA